MKPDQRIGRYIIIKEIGRGGMGLVYRAYDPQEQREVALKIIKPDDSQTSTAMSKERLHRFAREIETTKLLNHPHIVSIFEVNLNHSPPYIAMQFLAGGNLRQRLTQPLSWRQTFTLLRPLIQALIHIHRVGIFHRDLKPGNIMFATDKDESLKLVDFGLAYQADATRITRQGDFVGTLAYLSPEQAKGDAVDSQADIFALGIILIELITGINPLERDTAYLTFNQIISEQPVDISSLQGRLPKNVFNLISQATAKERHQRYPNCETLLDDLDHCLGRDSSASFATIPKLSSKPQIRVATSIELSDDIKAILRLMFKEEQRIDVEAEFGRNFSGSRVFRVRSSSSKGKEPPLPSVVKIAPIGLIEQEWLAYTARVENQLVSIAEIAPPPALLDNAEWDGLRYKLFGGGIFEFDNLSDYCRRPNSDTSKIDRLLQDHLFKELYARWWRYADIEHLLWLQADYDESLPINLMLTPSDEPAGPETVIIEPERMPPPAIGNGDLVQIKGFVVTEIDYKPLPEVTLNLPDAKEVSSFSYRIRLTGLADLEHYRVNVHPDPMLARVTDTRHTILLKTAEQAFDNRLDLSGEQLILPSGLTLPNPLMAYQTILQSPREIRVGTIHGDLNLENILVDEKEAINLIDFATVRQGHILHDLLRLETDIVIKLISEVVWKNSLPPETICTLYRQLHQAQTANVADDLPHPDLQKPFHKLRIIRSMARKCLTDEDNWAEYYKGLTLYLLGALKFRSSSIAKQLLVLGAATAVGLLTGEKMSTNGKANSMPDPIQKNIEDKTMQQDPQKVNRVEITGDRNVTGDINIKGSVKGNVVIGGDLNQSPQLQQPSDKLLTTARKMLATRKYDRALNFSRQVLEQEPDHGQANLIAAIALMQNRNASDLNDNAIDQIEDHLDFARSDSMTEITALTILGIVKHDHYLANNSFEGTPTFAEIVKMLHKAGLQGLDHRLLKYVKASSLALKQLGLRG